MTEIAKVSCELIEDAGYEAGVYANQYYWDSFLDNEVLGEYHKWIAKYGTNNGLPSADWRPDSEYHMWQYTSVGSIAGYNGNIDLNVMYYK